MAAPVTAAGANAHFLKAVMDIKAFCASRGEALTDAWVTRFFASYPIDSTGFMRTRRDRFANPVGETTRNAAALLFRAVIGEDVDSEDVKTALHDLVWIRAVQDMTPSQAVGAVVLLKDILRKDVLPECTKPEHSTSGALQGYLEMESRIDTLCLLALDMYAEARERVFRARIEDIKQSQSQVIRLAGLRRERPEQLPETDNEG